jgi:hypothetical protein
VTASAALGKLQSVNKINDFLAREDLENQCLGKEVVTQVEQYDFVSKLPPCLRAREGFAGISHDLEQTTGKMKYPLLIGFHVSLSLTQCTVTTA